MANGCLAGLGVPLVSFLLCRPPGSSGGAWTVPVLGSGLEFLFSQSAGFRRRYEPWSVVMTA